LTLTSGDEAAIIAVGATLVAGSGAGIFKAASLRGDTNAKWNRRVEYAVAALDEKALAELEQLRDDVEDILPAGPGFDPSQAIANPAALSERAERTVRFYRARTRMQRDFERLCSVCPVLVGALTGFLIAVCILTSFYADLVTWGWVELCGLIILAAAVVTLVVTTVLYVVLQHRLASAEILAGTGGRSLGSGSG
jgi:hypothetical protein